MKVKMSEPDLSVYQKGLIVWAMEGRDSIYGISG